MFCPNCGAQLTGAFCTQCGARAVQPPPPVQPAAPQPSSQPLPPAAKTGSGSGMKILFAVLGVIVFLGVLFVGAIWYGWHKVKQTIASRGIDLNTEVDRGAGRQLDACELLTKEELAQILDLAIERSEGTGRSTHSTCRYYSAAAQQRGADQAAAAFKKLQEASKSSDSPAQRDEALKNLESMVRGVAGAAAGTVNDAVLTIEVESENAKAAMAGFRLGAGLGAAVVGADAKPEARKALSEEVQGVGDEAVFGPLKSLLMFRKGDVSVQIDARTLPSGRDTEIAIAQRIAAKL
jgi:hypothetical protein